MHPYPFQVAGDFKPHRASAPHATSESTARRSTPQRTDDDHRTDAVRNSGSEYHLMRRARIGGTPLIKAIRYSPESWRISAGNNRGRDASDQLRVSEWLRWPVAPCDPPKTGPLF
jgi:hypothetical protein